MAWLRKVMIGILGEIGYSLIVIGLGFLICFAIYWGAFGIHDF